MDARKIESTISDALQTDQRFTMTIAGKPERMYGEPRFGVAAGDDPLWAFFKRDIGEFMWSPLEALRLEYPDTALSDADVSVISFVLPMTKPTRDDQAARDKVSGPRWALARLPGQKRVDELTREWAAALRAEGVAAVAPEQNAAFKWHDSAKYGFASSWSQRHAAYAAGLGAFGLSDGFISVAGVAARYGSIVVGEKLPVTQRRLDGAYAACLYKRDGSCGACMARCPAGAITPEGHDKMKCREYLQTVISPYSLEHYGHASPGCGFCQTGVPCEDRIP